MKTKELFIDVETTGLNAYKNDIVQLSAIVEIDGEEKARMDILSRPINEDNIDKKALEVIGKTKAELMEYPPAPEAYTMFRKTLDKFVDKYDKTDKFTFIGYNARFDEDFLRQWFYKNGNKFYGSYFHWPAIDISNICALYLHKERPTMKNFKLMTVAKAMGIEVEEEKAHDAMYDIIITRKMYQAIRPLLTQKAQNSQV